MASNNELRRVDETSFEVVDYMHRSWIVAVDVHVALEQSLGYKIVQRSIEIAWRTCF
jgi:hypothetical protein